MIQLASDDDFMAALHIQISELELDLYESQKQVNRLIYATYDQIWEMQQIRNIDEINLQNDEMQIDCIILDVDCNTPDCFNLPQRQCSTHIQRMPPIKGSEIGGYWGIRLQAEENKGKKGNSLRRSSSSMSCCKRQKRLKENF